MDGYDFDIINKFLGGASQTEIAASQGISPSSVSARMRKPDVQDEIRRRLNKVGDKLLTFKLDAIDGAVDGLQNLRTLAATTINEETKRKTSNDLIRVAGLEPRRRVLVESNNFHGIDEDTREFFKQVMHEADTVIDSTKGA